MSSSSLLVALPDDLLEVVAKKLWRKDPLALLCLRFACKTLRQSSCSGFEPPATVRYDIYLQIIETTVTKRLYSVELQLCLLRLITCHRWHHIAAAHAALYELLLELHFCVRGLLQAHCIWAAQPQVPPVAELDSLRYGWVAEYELCCCTGLLIHVLTTA